MRPIQSWEAYLEGPTLPARTVPWKMEQRVLVGQGRRFKCRAFRNESCVQAAASAAQNRPKTDPQGRPAQHLPQAPGACRDGPGWLLGAPKTRLSVSAVACREGARNQAADPHPAWAQLWPWGRAGLGRDAAQPPELLGSTRIIRGRCGWSAPPQASQQAPPPASQLALPTQTPPQCSPQSSPQSPPPPREASPLPGS